MWRWTAIVAAGFGYLLSTWVLGGVVTGTTQAEQFVVNFVPMLVALAFLAVVLFAIR